MRGAGAVALAGALSVGLDGTALSLAAAAAAAAVLVLGAWRQEADLDAIGAFLAAVSFAAFLAEPGIAPPIAWSGIAAGLTLLTLVRPLSARTSVAAYGGLGLSLLGLLRLDGEELVLVETGAAGHAAAWFVLALAAATAFEVGTRLARRPATAVSREGEESTPFVAGLAIAAGLCLLVSGLLLVALLALVVVALSAAARLGSRSHLALAAAAGLVYPLWATVIGLDDAGRVAAGLALTALAGAVLAELAGPDRELDRLSLGGVTDAVAAAPWRALVLGAQAFACVVATAALLVAVDDDALRAVAISVAAVAVAAAIQVAAGWRIALQASLAGLVLLALGLSLEVARPCSSSGASGPMPSTWSSPPSSPRACSPSRASSGSSPPRWRTTPAVPIGVSPPILAGVATLFAASLAVRAAVPHLGGGADAQFQRSQTAVSILWALAAIALLFAGLARRERLLRLGGFVLLGVAVAKIFLFDLDRLSSLARALSFLGVGALLLVGGWLVQRYAERLEGGDSAVADRAARGAVAGTPPRI